MISARNKFAGKAAKVEKGAVNGIVTVDVNGEMITSTISNASIEELGLEAGKDVIAYVKATEVLVGMGELKLSARNKFAGKVVSVEKGAVNAIVKLETKAGIFTSTISNNAVEELGLAEGVEAIAVVKATSVMIGC